MTEISGTPLVPTSERSTDYGLWALTFSYVLSQFFRSYVAVISTQLIADFHFTPQMFGWFSGAFFLVFAAAQIPVGFMFDRYGVRYPTAVLMSVGTLSAGVISVTTDPRLAIIAQAGIGIGCAPVFMGLLNHVLRHGAGPRDVRSITTASAIGMAGGLLAAFPLSWGTANFGWRPVMALSAMLMLLATLGVIFFVRRRDEKPLHKEAPAKTVTPARTSGLWTLMPVCLAMSVGGTFRTSWGGPYLADVFGFDVMARGNAMTVMSIAGIGASFCIPFFVRRWPPKSLSLGWQAAGILSALLLAFMPQRSPILSVAAICLLLSVGCIHPLVMSQARSIIAPNKLGLGLGLLNSLVFLGVALASSIFGLIAEHGRVTGVSSADLYSRLFVVTALPLTVGALAFWFSPASARK
ncbi:MFS transporter [Caballeronia sp. 15715]|uniref:MFS transporter n=1 Tax=unclassified Caballeronia TaxID=2646786 RepID=UPI0039E4C36F